MVMATQNPIEYEGTFPLPEAQLDRFLIMITLGYPTPEQELQIVEDQRMAHPIESLKAVTSADEIISVQDAVRDVYVDDLIKQYIVAINEATRHSQDIALGSSPRGSLALFRGAQAMALIRGRDYVLQNYPRPITPIDLGLPTPQPIDGLFEPRAWPFSPRKPTLRAPCRG